MVLSKSDTTLILREQVPDPLKLTRAEIKTYGLKPIFKADISGWLVTIEAPWVS